MIGRVRLLMRLCAFKLFNLASPRPKALEWPPSFTINTTEPKCFPWLGAALRHLSYAHWRCWELMQRVGKVRKMDNSNEPQAVCLFFQVRFMLALPPSRSSKDLLIHFLKEPWNTAVWNLHISCPFMACLLQCELLLVAYRSRTNICRIIHERDAGKRFYLNANSAKAKLVGKNTWCLELQGNFQQNTLTKNLFGNLKGSCQFVCFGSLSMFPSLSQMLLFVFSCFVLISIRDRLRFGIRNCCKMQCAECLHPPDELQAGIDLGGSRLGRGVLNL